jgi:hypothetical protein
MLRAGNGAEVPSANSRDVAGGTFDDLVGIIAVSSGNAYNTAMKSSCLLLAGLLVSTFSVSALPRPGDVVLEENFDAAGVLKTWGAVANPRVRLAPGIAGGQALEISAPPGVTSNVAVRVAIPVEKIRGARLRCEGMVQAADVTAPPKPWNGIKLMLHLSGPDGQQWLQQNNLAGTFDRRRVRFNATVPDNVTSAALILGLESVHGVARFDDVKVTVIRGPRATNAVAAPVGPPFKGHDLPRLRGAMIHPDITAESLRVLGKEWNANVIRWQLIRTGKAARSVALTNYDEWLDGELRKLDAALPLCAELGVRMVLDLHSPPGGAGTAGGYVGSDSGLFTNRMAQVKFVEIWRRMAKRYRDSAVIWGYDLANEPVDDEVGDGCEDWQALATRAARAVREIDARHAIIIEPSPWGGPGAIRNLDPVPVSGVVYSVHMYEPGHFTHQGVHGHATGVRYPGVIQGKTWDKEALRRALQPVVEFQQRHNAHIFLGEFSAIRWAPDDSALRYLRDCIELFEESGWDWTYHAFREWHGWSVEHGSDPANNERSPVQTDRERLLREWFGKNVKGTAAR